MNLSQHISIFINSLQPAHYQNRNRVPGPPPPGFHRSSPMQSERREPPSYSQKMSSLVSEVIVVPDELRDWVLGSKVQTMFLKVKEASSIDYITSQTNNDGDETSVSILIHAPSAEAAKIARMLVEINFKEQIKYQNEMKRLHLMQESLLEVQGEVASGQRIEFNVSPDVVGLMIGKKGARVHAIESDTGVNTIDIDGETGRVVIQGPTALSVHRARELLELSEQRIALPPEQVSYLLREYSYLVDLKSMSDCHVVRVDKESSEVVLIGTKSSLTSAKLILATQADYISKRSQLRESQQAIRQQLSSISGDQNRGRGSFYRGEHDERISRRKGGSSPAVASAGRKVEVMMIEEREEKGVTKKKTATTTPTPTPEPEEERKTYLSRRKRQNNTVKNEAVPQSTDAKDALAVAPDADNKMSRNANDEKQSGGSKSKHAPTVQEAKPPVSRVVTAVPNRSGPPAAAAAPSQDARKVNGKTKKSSTTSPPVEAAEDAKPLSSRLSESVVDVSGSAPLEKRKPKQQRGGRGGNAANGRGPTLREARAENA